MRFREAWVAATPAIRRNRTRPKPSLRSIVALAVIALLVGAPGRSGDPAEGGATGWFDPIGNHRFQLARGIALGDLDGDGDLDLYTAYYNFETAFRNDGGSFNIFTTVATQDVRTVALGDLDGDNDLDAFVGGGEEDGDGSPSRVRFNQGNFSFVDSGQALGDAETTSVALGDLDGDGDLDAVALTESANQVWVNQGGAQAGTEGTFALGPQNLGTGGFGTLALGDLDGDDDLDIVIPVSGITRIFRNDGAGMFTDTAIELGSAPSTPHVALADLDGDGDLDAFVSTNAGETIWRNETPPMGPLTFADTGQILGLDLRASRGVALGDLDADGDVDAVVAREPASIGSVFLPDVPVMTLTVWNNDGTGVFSLLPECFAPAVFLPAPPLGDPISLLWSESPVLGDVDGDLALDLVTTHADGFRWWTNGAPAGTSRCCALESAAYGADSGPGPPPLRRAFGRLARGLRAVRGLAALLGSLSDIDVGTYHAVQEVLLPGSTNGQRYLDFWAAHNDELQSLLVADSQLLADGAMTLALWADNLLALLDGTGAEVTITSEEIDAVDQFLTDVSAAGSGELAQAIADELAAIPPLQTLVGQTMDEARTDTIGPPAGSIIFEDGFESGDTSAWSTTVP